MTLRAAIKQKDEHKPINYLDPIASMNLSPFKETIDLYHQTSRQSVILSQPHICMQAVIISCSLFPSKILNFFFKLFLDSFPKMIFFNNFSPHMHLVGTLCDEDKYAVLWFFIFLIFFFFFKAVKSQAWLGD